MFIPSIFNLFTVPPAVPYKTELLLESGSTLINLPPFSYFQSCAPLPASIPLTVPSSETEYRMLPSPDRDTSLTVSL
jgi:hypothetical protein|nr:hypothetical protein [Halorubrum lacusprofundi]